MSNEKTDLKKKLLILTNLHSPTLPAQIWAEFIETLHSLEVLIQLKISCPVIPR
jgi:hypothetical protein